MTQTLNVNNKEILLDDVGFLKNLEDWNEDIANAFAREENIQLSEAHWEVIHLLREFYQQFEISPAMRILVKQVKQKLGDEKGKSVYLLKLFPESPARVASRIAGLPKPTNCL